MFHSHSYCGTTTFNDGHVHHYGGVTAQAPSGVQHTHKMEGMTTLNDKHAHPYCTETGPAIYTPSGHTHCYCATAECADGHIHCMEGRTSFD